MKFRIILLFTLSGIFCAHLQAQEKLSVVTSIRPLQLIANEIMAGTGQAQVLIANNESPHHFQLKPSQLKTLSHSDLLVWVSNDFETALGRLQQNLPASSRQLQLARLLPSDKLISDHGIIDGHIWLSAQNIILIGQFIAAQISRLDPQNQARYQENTQQLIDNLKNWQQQAGSRLEQAKPAYLLDHQFMNYFERSMGLPRANSIRGSHDHGGSIRQLSRLHTQLKAAPVSCLLVSSLPASKQTRLLAREHGLTIKLVDTLNHGNLYQSIIELLDAIVSTLEDCA